ncbi:MAG: hypothetical protein QN144_14690 [Armatimonadota bacterium]|nr:hypothetical protein [Armatimonadota bacterium]
MDVTLEAEDRAPVAVLVGMSHLGDPRCVCGSREAAASRDVTETCVRARRIGGSGGD